ncbi:hypothetical protein MYOV003v1_p0208 [Vibrio phage 207E48.1]|nr:hypothetical protein MYOV003v1_p0208 [Vibrio phage 207E48.1]
MLQCIAIVCGFLSLYSLVFLRRIIVGSLRYNLFFLREGQRFGFHNVQLEYSEYDADQGCHFYRYYLGEHNIGSRLSRVLHGYYGYVSFIEPLKDIEQGISYLPVEYMLTDFTGITHVRSLEDGWKDKEQENG